MRTSSRTVARQYESLGLAALDLLAGWRGRRGCGWRRRSGVGDGGGRLSSRPGRATQDLLARAPAATAGGAGPPAGAAPAGRRRCAPRSNSGAGPGRCAGAAAVLNIFDTSNHKLVAHNRVPITQIVHNLKWFDIYIIVY